MELDLSEKQMIIYGLNLKFLGNLEDIGVFSFFYTQDSGNVLEVYPAISRWGRKKFQIKGLRASSIGDTESALDKYAKEHIARGLSNTGVGINAIEYVRKVMANYLQRKYPSGKWKISDYIILKEIYNHRNYLY